MTKFRGCIDIHEGVVKQIVGGTLNENSNNDNDNNNNKVLKTNHIAKEPAEYFANKYKEYNIKGCHVIKLGKNCDEAANKALLAWPNKLQIGGGINSENGLKWLNKGAEKIIVTSYLFPDLKNFSIDRLKELYKSIGNDKNKLVIDLSCRRIPNKTEWFVTTNKWQTITNMKLNKETMELLSNYCSEFLVHAADVEGLCNGIDKDLVYWLAKWSPIPVTYAGGGKSIQDLQTVKSLSNGSVDLTFGSALDLFGGDKVRFMDCVEWNLKN